MVRKLLSFLIVVLFLLSCSSEQNQEAASSDSLSIEKPQIAQVNLQTSPKRYSVKDGKITYRYEGIQRGTEVVYFRDYGMTEIKFTETVRDNPFKGKIEDIKLITLMYDSNIYVVDQLTMNARVMDNSLLYESALRSPTLDLNAVAEQMYSEQGGKMEGIENIAGVPAKHWIIPSTKMQEWRWKGIMVQTIVDLQRNFVRVQAEEIDTLSPVPEDFFDLPQNVNLQEGVSMKEWIDELSKPIEQRSVFDFRDSATKAKAEMREAQKQKSRIK